MTFRDQNREAHPGPDSGRFPVGAAITLADLDHDPHRGWRDLRDSEPVSWLPALNGWLVTRHDLAVAVMRDSAAFTVDDPRFSTARVVGPSMLSLDGAEHGRHRAPFTRGFSRGEIHARLAAFVTAESDRLVAAMRPAGAADARRSLAGPLAVAVVAEALGLGDTDPAMVLDWYGAIVGSVSDLAAEPWGGRCRGRGGVRLAERALYAVIGAVDGPSSLLADAAGARAGDGDTGLSTPEAISNAAVIMFGGIETTEGMIGNAILHLLSHPGQLALVKRGREPRAQCGRGVLRLEPAAAVVDRYATRDVRLGGAAIRRGDLVTVSLAGRGPRSGGLPRSRCVRRPPSERAGEPRLRPRPALLPGRPPGQAGGPGGGPSRPRLPGLRLDPDRPAAPRGLVFRKPPSLHLLWDPA